MKRVIWIGSAKKDLQQHFSRMAQRGAGYQNYRLQEGFDPKDWKPLHGVGPGSVKFASMRRTNIGSSMSHSSRRLCISFTRS